MFYQTIATTISRGSFPLFSSPPQHICKWVVGLHCEPQVNASPYPSLLAAQNNNNNVNGGLLQNYNNIIIIVTQTIYLYIIWTNANYGAKQSQGTPSPSSSSLLPFACALADLNQQQHNKNNLLSANFATPTQTQRNVYLGRPSAHSIHPSLQFTPTTMHIQHYTHPQVSQGGWKEGRLWVCLQCMACPTESSQAAYYI